MKIVTVQEMRAIEQASVEHGVSLDELQQNAAGAIADHIRRYAGAHLFLIGPGNNGRDALIAAVIGAEDGKTSWAYLAPKVASDDVQLRLREAGGKIFSYEDDPGLDRLRQLVADALVVVDGLLGIGIHGPVREPMASIIKAADVAATTEGKLVVAVDLPSGVDADSGEAPGAAIHATETLSLGCVKTGLLVSPASGYTGRLFPVEIGLPPETYRDVRRELIGREEVARLLPKRPRDAHKGTFGRVLVVAGSANFVGAPYLVGAAAARSGCGIVTLAVPEWQRVPLVTMLPEATYLPLRETRDSRSATENSRTVVSLLPECDALAIGPGLGQGDAQTEFVQAVLEAARDSKGLRVVIDADALNALARIPDWFNQVGPGRVLTPHPGEMSRLTGLPVAEINRKRLQVASDAAARWGQVVVLKGAYTVIAAPDGRLWVSSAADSSLATAGSGDVLTGIIAGLMAQGMEPAEAGRTGVFIHADTGRRALSRDGRPTRLNRLLASDLLPQIPWALAYPLGDDAGAQ